MTSSARELTAVVDLCLDADEERSFQLPGSGSPSLLYVFDSQQIGALAVTADGADFVPGSRHKGVTLTFWSEEARVLVTEGAAFSVWYGDLVGDGVVHTVGWRR